LIAVKLPQPKMPGKLYLVATPIGNLQDISLRAIETLRAADLIACEDTRRSQKLLNHLGIKKKLVSYHEHNEETRASELIQQIDQGASIGLISDAGTPAINDPGYRIVQQAIEEGIDVISIPGPSAVITALAGSGLPTDSFFFGGFLPARKGERKSRLRELTDIPGTLVFYEAPHRVAAALADCLEELGDRQAVVARELTKIHEEFIRGPLSSLVRHFSEQKPKGEMVLLIDRAGAENVSETELSTLSQRVSELESTGLDRRAALKQAAREFGLSRSEAYRELQIAKKS
jgi:16S rRNA (cytidine1402-2'-O)-methyltransferase